MARTNDWEQLAMAQGDPRPTWPLPSVVPKFATWSLGGGRPFACTQDKCERWHAGIDLTNAPDGALILAPEDAIVVAIDRGWSEGSKAAFLRTSSGLFLVLGGFKAGSHKEHGISGGQQVRKGDKLGRVLGSYGMIHLETYTAASRTANSVWWQDDGPPEGLLNPTNYVERMVGDKVSLLQTRQRHEALQALGFFKGDVGAPWGPASEAALKAAQTSLGIAADGKWGPQTEDAIHKQLGPACTGDACSAGDGAGKDEGTVEKRPRTSGGGAYVLAGAAVLTTVAVGVVIWRARA
jgi:hypothetical protein